MHDAERGSGRDRRPLRVGIIAPVAHRTPPRGYGPWEQVASHLTEGLVALGCEVTLFATADSETSAELHAEISHGYAEDPEVDPEICRALHVSGALTRASEFDVLSSHCDFFPVIYGSLVKAPIVTTIHSLESEEALSIFRSFDSTANYVSISAAHRHSDLSYAATVHHGIDLRQFNFESRHGSYLLFFGRVHPDKGTHHAIEVARRAQVPLVIAGIITNQAYFEAEVKPHLDGGSVTFVGDVQQEQRSSVLGGALALLHLIDFDEPFGLSVVEALATGTPVIAHPRGSLPEIIIDGVTGFLVTDHEDAVQAVLRVRRLDRAACRRDVESRFTAEHMASSYAALFRTVSST